MDWVTEFWSESNITEMSSPIPGHVKFLLWEIFDECVKEGSEMTIINKALLELRFAWEMRFDLREEKGKFIFSRRYFQYKYTFPITCTCRIKWAGSSVDKYGCVCFIEFSFSNESSELRALGFSFLPHLKNDSNHVVEILTVYYRCHKWIG